MSKLFIICLLLIFLSSGFAGDDTHFVPPDDQYQPMTVWIYGITMNGRHLSSGDEVAVFNKDTLVAAGVLGGKVTIQNPFSLSVSTKWDTAVGFKEGDTLIFRLWDYSAQEEMVVEQDDVIYYNNQDGSIYESIQTFSGLNSIHIEIKAGESSAVRDSKTDLQDFKLYPNHPNPFNPATELQYLLERNGHVSLRIFDVTGRCIRQLVNDQQSPGFYSVQWDGKDDTGNPVASGTFFYQLSSNEWQETKKMTLIR